MKKYVIGTLIAVLAISMVLIGISCKTTTVTETAAAETTAKETTVTETAAAETIVAEVKEAAESGAFKDFRFRFFCGGSEGCPFASVVYKGALAAQELLGVQVDYVWSNWDPEKMINDLRDAIAANPDGISMMGHPGDDAIMPLAEEAYNKGILMTYSNVDVPKVREKFGGGYIGADLVAQGTALGEEALKRFDLKEGDRVAVYGNWGMPGRYIREDAVAKVFEKAGLIVERIIVPTEAITDTELLLPTFTADILAHPETKLVCFANSTSLGATPTYIDAAGLKPGDIKVIGFDNSEAIMDAFKRGYVHLSSDQQQYLQGYLPILSLTLAKAYGFSLFSVDTGKGFITEDNYDEVEPLVKAQIR